MGRRVRRVVRSAPAQSTCGIGAHYGRTRTAAMKEGVTAPQTGQGEESLTTRGKTPPRGPDLPTPFIRVPVRPRVSATGFQSASAAFTEGLRPIPLCHLGRLRIATGGALGCHAAAARQQARARRQKERDPSSPLSGRKAACTPFTSGRAPHPRPDFPSTRGSSPRCPVSRAAPARSLGGRHD